MHVNSKTKATGPTLLIHPLAIPYQTFSFSFFCSLFLFFLLRILCVGVNVAGQQHVQRPRCSHSAASLSAHPGRQLPRLRSPAVGHIRLSRNIRHHRSSRNSQSRTRICSQTASFACWRLLLRGNALVRCSNRLQFTGDRIIQHAVALWASNRRRASSAHQ